MAPPPGDELQEMGGGGGSLTPASPRSGGGISRRNRYGLCLLNFLSADIRDGLAPFASVYLLQTAKWPPHMIGIAMTANSFSQMAVQTPVGAFIDNSIYKMTIIVACCVLVSVMSVAIIFETSYWFVIVTRIIQAWGSATLPPAVAAITLGVTGPVGFAHQISYNEMFNHGGMAACSLGAGLAAHFIEPSAAFYIVGATGLASIFCLPLITGIDHGVARGLASAEEDNATKEPELQFSSPSPSPPSAPAEGGGKDEKKPVGYAEVLADSRILSFCICVFGFHFGNASMLPMMGQKLSLGDTTGSTIAQLTACRSQAESIVVGHVGACLLA